MEYIEKLPAPNISALQSPTFGKDGSFEVNEAVGSASISPCGRDIVLASRQGLHIIDLDNPYSPPRHLPHRTPWEVADVQWSPFAARDYWVVSTSNQKALVWNLEMSTAQAPIEHVLHAHSRAITDINFSAHHPDSLATCAIDSFVHCWDLRNPQRPAITFADWFAGATQVKWNRQDAHIIASSHDKMLHIWDDRKALHPLRSIPAHATKIYGVDWNRTSPTRLLTCSLDKTIKLWDYSRDESLPTQVFRTSYPVWRARHTPFGNGVLAMPQRGNFNLHLYNYGNESPVDDAGITPSSHCFRGHQNQVKEFLWRVRGSVDGDSDNREFQLVTWSNDKSLLLHRIDDSILAKADFRPGGEPSPSLKFTRRGARYRTFHAVPGSRTSPNNASAPATTSGLSSLVRDMPRPGGLIASGTKSSRSSAGMNIWNLERRGHNPITWMKGVKISKAEAGNSNGQDAPRLSSSQAAPWDTPEGLGDEITYVGDKFKNVTFEEVNVPARSVAVTLNGPWGIEGELVHMQFQIKFPIDYPEKSPPEFTLEKRSAVSDATFLKLSIGLRTIAVGYSSLGKGSFEALLGYLLGERDLDDTTAWLSQETSHQSIHSIHQDDESSSDEDDTGLEPFGFAKRPLDNSGTETIITTNQTAHPPPPKTCGATWAANGVLVCFFPNKESKFSITNNISGEENEHLNRTPTAFEGFGRLPIKGSKGGKTATSKNTVSHNEDSGDESVSSLSLSSSSSESSVEDFFPQPTWRASSLRRPYLRSLDRSLKSSAPTVFKHNKDSISKSFVSLYDLTKLLPAKQELGLKYEAHGFAASACLHNAEVAVRHGYHDLGDIWSLVHLLLLCEVPLEALSLNDDAEDVYILARRALVQIRRRDSGLDLAFDEPESIATSKVTAPVKWGNHPLATWLVQRLFDHFEKRADIQMFALLSCVFSVHHNGALSSGEGAPTSNFVKDQNPVGTGPILTHSYFPTPDVALSVKDLTSPNLGPSSPRKLLTLHATSYGSHSSSIAATTSDKGVSDHQEFLSAGHTPPSMTRQHSRNSAGGQSYDASLEEHQAHRSNSSVSNSLGISFTRSFSLLGTSPPVQHKRRKSVELSTSAPGANSGITWGKNQIFEATKASMNRRKSRASIDYQQDDSDTDAESAKFDDLGVDVVLKNQDMFDDEAHVTLPLLSSENESKAQACRRAYANLLYSWNLPLAACEILQFNASFSTSDTSAPAPSSSHPAWDADKRLANDTTPSAGQLLEDYLSVDVHCASCGGSITSPSKRATQGQRSECASCRKPDRLATCTFCGEAIAGLFKACLRCGHTTHLTCLQIWLADEDLANPQCEAGCGCACWEESMNALEDAEDEEIADIDDDLQTEVRKELSADLWRRPYGASTQSGRGHDPSENEVLPWGIQNQYRELSIARRKFSAAAYHDF